MITKGRGKRNKSYHYNYAGHQTKKVHVKKMTVKDNRSTKNSNNEIGYDGDIRIGKTAISFIVIVIIVIVWKHSDLDISNSVLSCFAGCTFYWLLKK